MAMENLKKLVEMVESGEIKKVSLRVDGENGYTVTWYKFQGKVVKQVYGHP